MYSGQATIATSTAAAWSFLNEEIFAGSVPDFTVSLLIHVILSFPGVWHDVSPVWRCDGSSSLVLPGKSLICITSELLPFSSPAASRASLKKERLNFWVVMCRMMWKSQNISDRWIIAAKQISHQTKKTFTWKTHQKLLFSSGDLRGMTDIELGLGQHSGQKPG